MSQQPETIDFDLVYRELQKGLDSERQRYLKALSGPVYVQEFRTIHMSTGRQSGRSSWARNKIQELNAILVLPDDLSRSNAIAQMDEKYHGNIVTVQELVGEDNEELKDLLADKTKTFFIDIPSQYGSVSPIQFAMLFGRDINLVYL